MLCLEKTVQENQPDEYSFGLYQPTSGIIKKNGQEVHINTPNDANDLNIGMVHQHFKLVECFSVLDNIILGVERPKAFSSRKRMPVQKSWN